MGKQQVRSLSKLSLNQKTKMPSGNFNGFFVEADVPFFRDEDLIVVEIISRSVLRYTELIHCTGHADWISHTATERHAIRFLQVFDDGHIGI